MALLNRCSVSVVDGNTTEVTVLDHCVVQLTEDKTFLVIYHNLENKDRLEGILIQSHKEGLVSPH